MTLAAALSRVADLRDGGWPDGGAAIVLRGGTWRLTQPIVLGSQHSGSPGSPLVITAAPGERVTLSGSVQLTRAQTQPITSAHPLFNRLPIAARSEVRVLPASATGLPNPGLVSRGFCARPGVGALEFRAGTSFLRIARWPNPEEHQPPATDAALQLEAQGAMTGTFVRDGMTAGRPRFRRTQLLDGRQYWLYFLEFTNPAGLVGWFLAAQPSGYPPSTAPFWYRYTSELGPMDPAGQSNASGRISWDPPDRVFQGFSVVQSGTGSRTLGFGPTRPLQWASPTDAWLYGYLAYPWEDCWYPLTGLDPVAKTFTLGRDAPFGIAQGGHFTVLNVPEELDQPGEWLWHSASSTYLLWLPPAIQTFEANALGGPLVRGAGTRDLVLRDLELEGSRATLAIFTGDRIEVRGGAFRAGGTGGLEVTGNRAVVRDVLFEGLGSFGTELFGGDRPSLSGGQHLVEGSEFRDFSRVERTYSPGVGLYGVGHQLRRSFLHDTPHEAIAWLGNDHVIELNEVARACSFSSDCGALYTGRDFGLFGNVVRHNYIHDITSPVPGFGAHAIYFDDLGSGMTAEGNVLVDIQDIGVMHGGGRDVAMRSNLIVRARIGLESDARGRVLASNGLPLLVNDDTPPDSWSLLAKLRAVSYRSEPWLSRYPRCAAIPDQWSVILQDVTRWLGPEGSSSVDNAAWQTGTFEYEQGVNVHASFALRQGNVVLQRQPFLVPSDPRQGLVPGLAAPAAIQTLPFADMGLPRR